MMRRLIVVMALAILTVYAGSAMAQAAPPRPAAPPEQPSAVPAPPVEVTPEAAQQPPAPAQATAAPLPMKQRMPRAADTPPPPPPPPPALGKWWKDSTMVNELKLTPEQISQLEKSFFDHRLKLINLNAALEVAETQLEALLDVDRPEEAKVSAQIDQVTQARGNLEKENAMMMLGVRRVLSVEQWKNLQQIQQQQMGTMRMKQRMPVMEGMPEKRPAPRTPRPPEE